MVGNEVVQRLISIEGGDSAIQRIRVTIPDEVLTDLQTRLGQTRWPDEIDGQAWELGTDLSFLRRLCEHWRERFDWRAAEARLNELPQFRATLDGICLYFVHARATTGKGVPLLLVNGWPSSIFEYLDVIPRLTAAGFDVVAPALPGYGFSDRPPRLGMDARRTADMFARLMSELGYERFLAHGSDVGQQVIEALRGNHKERLLGAHYSNVFWGYPHPEDPTPEEQDYFRRSQHWQFAEGGYVMIQGTKPQTLSYGLNDSPAGLAAWILEKFHCWSDGDIEKIYGLDGLCANLMVYWATQTFNSSARMYVETVRDMRTPPPERGTVPVGVAIFPSDIVPAPRVRAERWLNIVHWTEMPRGGHFGAWEEPELFVNDLRVFADRILVTRNSIDGSV
ncbi:MULTISPECIES: epoxide hydrolase family protein [Paraburkholderia]|uniref:epoxide hydrolase family protein n=1 Tax=Paraburkholderia TaxID=1822464 RepID=UPI002257CABD|nr:MULTISPECIES: epoxide hydrolase family protein [Paraburkholderia]MCX4160020.1 epoxide hydrolase [Paraburkholderia megapolitana]MDN7155520.1 epoxide hydrolase [Paraburkholderia sp. CHISQ3]MDQ6492564.1 epoxide hydrolase [Paraburkholderia megapolitana]